MLHAKIALAKFIFCLLCGTVGYLISYSAVPGYVEVCNLASPGYYFYVTVYFKYP